MATGNYFSQGRHVRTVVQYHFTAWPDFGVPADETKLLDFMFAVKKDMNKCSSADDKPTLVHCR